MLFGKPGTRALPQMKMTSGQIPMHCHAQACVFRLALYIPGGWWPEFCTDRESFVCRRQYTAKADMHRLGMQYTLKARERYTAAVNQSEKVCPLRLVNKVLLLNVKSTWLIFLVC